MRVEDEVEGKKVRGGVGGREDAVEGLLMTLRVMCLKDDTSPRHMIWSPGRRPGVRLVIVMYKR